MQQALPIAKRSDWNCTLWKEVGRRELSIGRINKTPVYLDRVIGHENGMAVGSGGIIKTWTLRGSKGIDFVQYWRIIDTFPVMECLGVLSLCMVLGSF